jgi:hypothetical protein
VNLRDTCRASNADRDSPVRFFHPSGDVHPRMAGGRTCNFFWSLTMKSGRSLVDLARELERQISSKRDLVVPSSLPAVPYRRGRRP